MEDQEEQQQEQQATTTTMQISKTVEATIDHIDSITGLDKEDHENLWHNRTRMTWVALFAIIIPTMYIIVRISSPDLVDKLGVMMSWYYLALASVVGAYFGFRTWSTIKGK